MIKSNIKPNIENWIQLPLTILIKDTGIGIEKERKEYLFEPLGELKAKQKMSKVKD